ncbi:MAG: PD40 domain-containing protein [Myxococcales bacterium]|nr:PD40 domain-containing protein [Myxococcales bacterium]
MSVGAVALALAGCTPVERPVAVPALRLVVSERWNGGTRLVLVEEHGDRWAILSAGRGDAPARDEQAVVSPDGRWVAFVSSRGRPLDRTSLWIMPAAVGATAVRVTDGRGDDVDPTWTPAGDAVVFARRTGDRFALARVGIGGRADQPRIGEVEVVAAGAVHYLAPSVAPSGEIAYQEIDPSAGTSRIGLRAVDGSITFATDGPRDVTPAWRPGSGELAFAREIERADGGRDLDLWRLTADGDAAPLADLSGTDESGPRWSRDGRWLFATALARDDDGELPSVIYLDVAAPAPRARMLRDRAGTIARQGPAPMPVPLDDGALGAGLAYVDALAAALRERAYERELAATRAAAAVDAGL